MSRGWGRAVDVLGSRAAEDRTVRTEDLPWFAVRDLGDGVVAIAEPGHATSFLVLGATSAVLFDSGMGIVPIAPVVRGLTSLPVLVVNSHHHYDHRGGNASMVADRGCTGVAVHPAGVDLHTAAPQEFLDGYAKVAAGTERDFEVYDALDRQRFFLLTDAMRVRPTPDLGAWEIPAVRPTRTLFDGEELDLGGRVLRVLHAPGHSPDSLVLLDPAAGVLLAGDAVLAAASWVHFPEGDVAVFAETLARLARLRAHRVLVAHNLQVELPGAAVGRAAAAMAAVRDGHTVPHAGTDLFGNAVSRHEHHDVVVFTPPTGRHVAIPSDTVTTVTTDSTDDTAEIPT